MGIQLEKCLEDNPGIRGIVLGGHGLFTWGDTSYTCYMNSLEVIEMASQYIEDRIGRDRPVFGGQIIETLVEEKRKSQAADIAPILRGLCSSKNRMIGHFTDDARVLQFINSADLSKLAPLGTSCPDHFLRTKIQPLVLPLDAEADLSDAAKVTGLIEPAFARYRQDYAGYYETCKHPDSPAMRDANPVVILYSGVGMFTFAKNKQTARVASEFYINAINVMRGCEAVSEYTALSRQEAFNIEYWLLEEAKLKRQPPEKALSGRVALITGGGGGIGKAIAKRLAVEGANVVLTDIAEERVQEAHKSFKKDISYYTVCDVTKASSVYNAFKTACLEFGGVDIIVHSAGLAISKSLNEYTEEQWNLLQDVLVKGQFLLAKHGAHIMQIQDMDGDIINIVSKNALVAGPNNVAYGSAKAAQAHMSRLLASELGKDKIRVNVVNPDAVITDSKIWEGAWAEGRANAYGITVEELPAHYAKRTLMNEIILPEDIADAVFALLTLKKSTGNMINVDGGISAAFVR